MNILINNPLVKPHVAAAKYQGIERLGREFAHELLSLGHTVSAVAPKGSDYDPAITVFETEVGAADVEQLSYSVYADYLETFDVIHDLSHFHAPAMMHPLGKKLPTINIFWHDPYIAQFPEPRYNMVALSQWGADRFQEVYQQPCIHQETIIVDLEVYRPPTNGITRQILISVGLMASTKGHLEAMRLARKAGETIFVIGGKGPGDPEGYERMVKRLCDNEQIVFWGEVSDEAKIGAMQMAKALLYTPTIREVHSHKSIEAMACGCPVITYAKGALPEVIGNGGFCCSTEEHFINCIKGIDSHMGTVIDPRKWAQKWDVHKVVGDYIKLYEEVANGKRW